MDLKRHLGSVVSSLVLAAAACLASGAALATCNPVPAGNVPCYMTVQPIDVANTQNLGIPPTPTVVYNPFNSTSATGSPNTAGTPLQTLMTAPAAGSAAALAGTSIPNNPTSPNPIGFVVDPTSGLSPGQTNYPGKGIDVTRTLLNKLGVELVWLPMKQYAYPACPTSAPLGSCVAAAEDFTTLDVELASTGKSVATCTGYMSAGPPATLTINSASCSGTSAGNLAVYDFLSSGTAIASNTYITGLDSISSGTVTYFVNNPQNVGTSRKPISITATSSTLTSSLFKTLSQQDTTVTTPKAISTGGIPVAPLGGPNMDPDVVNLFFVNTLNPPPAIGGTLYGLAWLCNNGVAIASQTFAQNRPDTLAHELAHTLCLDHGFYGAGPWTQATGTNGAYLEPFGVVPQIPGTPVPGECDSKYPACGANLMTTGILRTEPTLQCILAGYPGTSVPNICKDASGNQLPGLYNPNVNLQTDQVTSSPVTQNGVTLLPVSQQGQAVQGLDRGLSGSLFQNTPTLQFSGLLNSIPQETTKAQLGTGGSSTDRAIFDLSGPAGGKPGETLLGWVLTLPQQQSFGRHDGFHIVSQSRKDLVQDVKYYPGPGNNPLKRNIAYQPGGDNNADDPSIGTADPSPCAFATAECLVVKFQPPGLEADDSISFSNSILSGDAPITNEDLCKAKITYIFNDGFVTTSNFGRCPPVSLPLIASSWRPDPYVAPHVVRSNLLLADIGSSPGCTPDQTTQQCPDVNATSIADSDALMDAGAPQQSCDGGVTMNGGVNNPVTGPIGAPHKQVILKGGQTCHYQGCEFQGSLVINNATAYLKNCTIDGLLMMNAGTLHLDTSVTVIGTTQIGSNVNLPSSFNIGPGVNLGGGLTIQGVPSGGLGYVCGTTVSAGVTVTNNQSLIQIGETAGQTNCPGNTIIGNLKCTGNNPVPTSGSNSVTGQNKCTG